MAYVDNLNLTYKTFTAKRTLHWCLLLEEFGPELCYVKGCKNIIAYALSHLPCDESFLPNFPYTFYTLAEMYGQELSSYAACPVDFPALAKA